jgi:hypothetical protein
VKSPIPEAALAQHIAVLGKTGSGKSYAVRGAAVEPLLDAGARVCIIDPTGAWHGLRSSANGSRAGYPVVIFGGEHADLPLGGAHGEAIAEVIGTSSTPSILDTSLMKVSERTRFFADFGDAIMRKNKGPLHLVIDEAHLFMPQGKVPSPQAGEMLAAGNNMVSGGRSRGLRIILITQRPAKLHKDSLTQVETLIAMRLIAPQDRQAVEDWIEDNADEKKAAEILSSLAMLKTGHGWIWAPEIGVLERVTFPKIKTFDSGRAPDGSEADAAKVLAPIDREAIAQKLQSVSAAALADDPKRLRARIADLERLNLAAATEPQTLKPAETRAAQDKGFEIGYAAGYKEGAEVGRRRLMDKRADFKDLRGRVHRALDTALNECAPTEADEVPKPAVPGPSERHMPVISRAHARDISRKDPGSYPVKTRVLTGANGAGDADLGSGGKRRILTALAQYPGGLSARKLSILIDMSPKGGTWRTYMAELRGKGWIDGRNDHLTITQGGAAALGSWEPLPTGDGLIQYWRQRLGESGKRAIFDVVVDAHPRAIAQESVAETTGIAIGGGTWRTYLAELRGLGLVEGRGELRASEDLFG